MHYILENIHKITIIFMVLSAIATILYPYAGLAVFAAYVGSLESYHFIRSRRSLVGSTDLNLSNAEKKVYGKHHIYFRYPATARECSSAYSLIQISSIGIGILLALRGLYLPALLAACNYFVAATLAMRLNPRHFYENANRLTQKQSLELLDIEDIIKKIKAR